jgi:hypothetical protein
VPPGASARIPSSGSTERPQTCGGTVSIHAKRYRWASTDSDLSLRSESGRWRGLTFYAGRWILERFKLIKVRFMAPPAASMISVWRLQCGCPRSSDATRAVCAFAGQHRSPDWSLLHGRCMRDRMHAKRFRHAANAKNGIIQSTKATINKSAAKETQSRQLLANCERDHRKRSGNAPKLPQ